MASFARAATRRALGCAMFLLALGQGSTLLAAGIAPDSASTEQQLRAQQVYEQGVQQFKTGRHADAAESFKASYEIVASPNSHLMYARALRDSGELEAAFEEFNATQKEAKQLAQRLPKYSATAESAAADLRELLKRVALLKIEIIGDSQVQLFVGSRQIARGRANAVVVEAGEVDVSVRFSDGRRLSKKASAKLGQIVRVELDLAAAAVESEAHPAAPPAQTGAPLAPSEQRDVVEDERPAPPSHELRPWAYAAGVLGVLGFAGFAVMGSMSRATFDELEQACPSKRCPPERAAQIDEGQQQQLWANVGLAVGVVGLSTGITLFVIDAGRSGSQGSGQKLQLVAWPGGAKLSGSF